MKLKSKYPYSKYLGNEYQCDLTIELDHLAGLERPEDKGTASNDYFWNHYILLEKIDIKNHRGAIRIPGGTIGSITFDENNIITSVKVSTDRVVKTYPDNVNEIINEKFVGEKLEF